MVGLYWMMVSMEAKSDPERFIICNALSFAGEYFRMGSSLLGRISSINFETL